MGDMQNPQSHLTKENKDRNDIVPVDIITEKVRFDLEQLHNREVITPQYNLPPVFIENLDTAIEIKKKMELIPAGIESSSKDVHDSIELLKEYKKVAEANITILGDTISKDENKDLVHILNGWQRELNNIDEVLSLQKARIENTGNISQEPWNTTINNLYNEKQGRLVSSKTKEELTEYFENQFQETLANGFYSQKERRREVNFINKALLLLGVNERLDINKPLESLDNICETLNSTGKKNLATKLNEQKNDDSLSKVIDKTQAVLIATAWIASLATVVYAFAAVNLPLGLVASLAIGVFSSLASWSNHKPKNELIKGVYKELEKELYAKGNSLTPLSALVSSKEAYLDPREDLSMSKIGSRVQRFLDE